MSALSQRPREWASIVSLKCNNNTSHTPLALSLLEWEWRINCQTISQGSGSIPLPPSLKHSSCKIKLARSAHSKKFHSQIYRVNADSSAKCLWKTPSCISQPTQGFSSQCWSPSSYQPVNTEQEVISLSGFILSVKESNPHILGEQTFDLVVQSAKRFVLSFDFSILPQSNCISIKRFNLACVLQSWMFNWSSTKKINKKYNFPRI